LRATIVKAERNWGALAASRGSRGLSRTTSSITGASNMPATPITRKAARQSIHDAR
jgi:hypothetical protein